jgi:hypothetical protein
VPYLAANDVPADPFGDMPTTENLLSVWEVAEDRSNIERIVSLGQSRLAARNSTIRDLLYSIQLCWPPVKSRSAAIKASLSITAQMTGTEIWFSPVRSWSLLST